MWSRVRLVERPCLGQEALGCVSFVSFAKGRARSKNREELINTCDFRQGTMNYGPLRVDQLNLDFTYIT